MAAGLIKVALETGERWTFVSALDWPGWARRGNGEGAALENLAKYRPRYLEVLEGSVRPSSGDEEMEVIERLAGSKVTDFGAPGAIAAYDRRDLDPIETERVTDILRACWEAFDRTASTAGELRKGPRGGGRDATKIIEHVNEADRAYLSKLGAGYRSDQGAPSEAEVARMREAFLTALAAAAAGAPPAKMPRKGPEGLWPPAYAVRRSAWHVLDHLWEIQDRS